MAEQRERAGSPADRRGVDFGALLSKLPLILTIGGLVLAMAQMYFQLQFVTSKINPEAIAKWERTQAETAGKAELTQDINNRRWCMQKMTLKGADIHEVMACFD
jgi:hypothetical protein